MDQDIINQVLEEIRKRVNIESSSNDLSNITPKSCQEIEEKEEKREAKTMYDDVPTITEYVGCTIGDTVGLVIANIDSHIHEKMKLDPKYRSLGIISSRTGAGPHIMAADEAVKATNTEIVSIETPRDTKGGAGHGSLIVFAAEDVSDARRAVEVTLKDVERTFGDVYGCDAGHVELHYTARASLALEKAYGAPIGKAFGIIVGAPAAVGLVMADTAMKTANVDLVTYASPDEGTAHSNEIIITITGDSGAVRQSVIAAREVGLGILKSMKQNPVSTTKPYI
ncbi:MULTISPECIES: propanediol utilization microcompartment protein PduB [Clostridium]|uniref:Propanediol utilization protein PduB n=2 Tax=Clostridium TaxID=1485 RepID=A0A151APE2_9CLOT|nr:MULTISPECIES: propanediol utilization microcompartment protein PduB [Clostridium]KYH29504.1 propanediol utilization protein PduB [Clostridium colicanis DSM 13634]PRR70737.1 Propanediol utilization protein PduB [Clostridium thermopalmarium DSM 5974]PVZ22581.1 microcompartment protein PduB [Clostridium thermopalmarium DSM 5974]